MKPLSSQPTPVLRPRDGHHARVTYEELFFDLVYVFAVTQLSHLMLHHPDWNGFVEVLILWFAVWLGWQYTCWVTNWFNPQAPPIRYLLMAVMLVALVMSASISQAFEGRALIFAGAFAFMQVGRTLYVLVLLGRDHPLAANFRRMLAWLCLSSVFWIAGAFAEHGLRIALWVTGIACQYLSPMIGFAFPGLGRSVPERDWTIEGAHLTERCQLITIIALGETLLVTGTTLAGMATWDAATLLALVSIFLGTIGLWWLYFGTAASDAEHTITSAADPGRIGALYHYIHAVLIAGIIGWAVGSEIVLAHPHGAVTTPYALILTGGPMIFLAGCSLYKYVVYGRVPLSHAAGIAVLAALGLLAGAVDLFVFGGLTTLVIFAVGLVEQRARRTAAAAA